MGSTFDNIAMLYSSSVPPVPTQYIELIRRTFDINDISNILDLGCGAGTLTFALLKISKMLQGVDESSEMIKLAMEHDINHLIRWHCESVASYNLGVDNFNLIISFEAFHLFPDPVKLTTRCSKALKPQGFFSIGWVNFEWEEPLKHVIWDVCGRYGISFADWGYWTCPNFPEYVLASQSFGPIERDSVFVYAKTSVQDIVDHMVSIEKASKLTPAVRQELARELTDTIIKVYPSGFSEGSAKYSIAYAQRTV